MNVEEFAVAFTVAVTEVSDPAVDLIAKNGRHSVFSVLEEIFPQAYSYLVASLQQEAYKKYAASIFDLTLCRRYVR